MVPSPGTDRRLVGRGLESSIEVCARSARMCFIAKCKVQIERQPNAVAYSEREHLSLFNLHFAFCNLQSIWLRLQAALE